MKPASFEYACPTSKREVLALLAEHGQDARSGATASSGDTLDRSFPDP